MKKKLVKLTGGTYSRLENGSWVKYHAGQTFTVNDREVEMLGNDIRILETVVEKKSKRTKFGPQSTEDAEREATEIIGTDDDEDDDEEIDDDEEEEDDLPDGVQPIGGGWYKLEDGRKIQGYENLMEYLEKREND